MKFKLMFVIIIIQAMLFIGCGYLVYLLVDGIMTYGLSGVVDKIWHGPAK